MAWAIEFDTAAQRELNKLDPAISRRILKFLLGRVAKLDDPRSIGERLQGRLHHLWKYRVGDYRILCSFRQEVLVVLVLEIGHRREIYKR
jgi:mRNA interferase RelE/StbE